MVSGESGLPAEGRFGPQAGGPPSLKFRRASVVCWHYFDHRPRYSSHAGALAQACDDSPEGPWPLAKNRNDKTGCFLFAGTSRQTKQFSLCALCERQRVELR